MIKMYTEQLNNWKTEQLNNWSTEQLNIWTTEQLNTLDSLYYHMYVKISLKIRKCIS